MAEIVYWIGVGVFCVGALLFVSALFDTGKMIYNFLKK